jgi:hypothetical protein
MWLPVSSIQRNGVNSKTTDFDAKVLAAQVLIGRGKPAVKNSSDRESKFSDSRPTKNNTAGSSESSRR